MAGYAARTDPARGTHDPLTLRALVVDTTAVVTVDVVGLTSTTCRRIDRRCPGMDVVVHAIHTHGGPVSTPGRLGGACDRRWLRALEDAAVDAVQTASAQVQPVTVETWASPGPPVAANRRRNGGPVDPLLPVIRLTRGDGATVATVVSYACHPVVLGADNLLLTADYPGPLRRRIETEAGGVALFLTGCAGDANPGQVEVDPARAAVVERRTFDDCAAIGADLAAAAWRGRDRATPAAGPHRAADEPAGTRFWSTTVRLPFDLPGADALAAEVDLWRRRAAAAADPGERALYSSWRDWARLQSATLHDGAPRPETWTGRVSILRWGPATIVALPGEPFATTGMRVRQLLGVPGAIVAGYCDGCPGYLPPSQEYVHSGYEVRDAHRYYGAPGPFAPGAAEALTRALAGRPH